MLWLHIIARRVGANAKKTLNHGFAPLIQSIVFWLGAWLLRDQGVSMVAWAVLYVCCVSAAGALQYSRFAAYQLPPRAWLLFAVNSALVAALFWGANTALDLINAPQRPKDDWATHLGGLELWFALCPGVVSVAISSYVRSLPLLRLPSQHAN